MLLGAGLARAFGDLSSRRAGGLGAEIDLYLGLVAEDAVVNSPLAPLLLRMVAAGAFPSELSPWGR